MAAVQAAYEFAQGLAWLALNFFFPNPRYATAATLAFGIVAAGTIVAGRAIAGNSFAQNAGSSSGSSSSPSASTQSGGNAPNDRTFNYGNSFPAFPSSQAAGEGSRAIAGALNNLASAQREQAAATRAQTAELSRIKGISHGQAP